MQFQLNLFIKILTTRLYFSNLVFHLSPKNLEPNERAYKTNFSQFHLLSSTTTDTVIQNKMKQSILVIHSNANKVLCLYNLSVIINDAIRVTSSLSL